MDKKINYYSNEDFTFTVKASEPIKAAKKYGENINMIRYLLSMKEIVIKNLLLILVNGLEKGNL